VPFSPESFNSKVKSDLCRKTAEKNCCASAELVAFLHFKGYVNISNRKTAFHVVVEEAPVARYFFASWKKQAGSSPRVIYRKGSRLDYSCFILRLEDMSRAKKVLQAINASLGGRGEIDIHYVNVLDLPRCCRRSYLKGAFMASGYLSSPRSGYHLELFSEYERHILTLKELLSKFGVEAGVRERKNGYYIYIKKADSIMEFLRLISAHNTLLQMENQRVFRSMRNQVNRVVNCETANLDKSLQASRNQVEFIEKIDRTMGLDKLPKNLQEVARLRLSHPEASLKELGEMLYPPVGKSGINHRFRKLEEISRQL